MNYFKKKKAIIKEISICMGRDKQNNATEE